MKTYEVRVGGVPLPVQKVRVSAIPFNKVWDGMQRPLSQTEEAYFVSLDMEERIKMEICVKEGFERYEIRPLSVDLSDTRIQNTVTLTIDRPMHFTFEADGYHNALHVFVNPKSQKPAPDKNIIYYGKGTHYAGLIWLESNQTLYIEEGAVVYGVVYAKDVHNAAVMGRGVLDSSPYRRGNDSGTDGREVIDALKAKGVSESDIKFTGNLVLYHCHDILIEGIILKDAPLWALITRNDCENITIDNVKIVGQWRYNADGIDICTSRNVIVKNCFVRSFDDCFVARGAYLDGEDGNVENITVENCVFWCDWGKSLEVWCGHKPTCIRNVTFKNNYLIHLCNTAMNITTWYGSNRSLIQNIVYQDIHIDPDDTYRSEMIESEENKSYVYQPGYHPWLIKISVEKLGRLAGLGTQKCEEVDDLSGFHLCYENILFDRIVCPDTSLPIRVKEKEGVLQINNITAKNCDFKIETEA